MKGFLLDCESWNPVCQYLNVPYHQLNLTFDVATVIIKFLSPFKKNDFAFEASRDLKKRGLFWIGYLLVIRELLI